MSFNDFNRINFPSVSKTNPRSRFVDEEEVPEPSSQKEFLRNIMFILPLIFFLFIFIFICVQLGQNGGFPSDKNGEAAQVITYLNTNLHETPIEELKVVKKGEACPLGYKKSIVGVFNGINSGCICEDGSVHSKSHCESNKNGQCTFYSGKSKESLHVWRNSVFCEKRYARWKFVSNKESCSSEGLFKCQDYICVDKQKCPVTSVKFLLANQTTAPADEVYTLDNMKVQIERSSSLYPLVNLLAVNTLIPCVIPGKEPNTQQKPYPLDKVNPKNCGRYGDIQHFGALFDQMKLFDYYTENGLTSPSIPYIQTYIHSDYVAKIYGVSRVPTEHDPNCQNIYPEKVERLDHAASAISAALTVFGIFILLICIAGIIISVMFIFRSKIKLQILQKKIIVVIIFGLALLAIFFIILQVFLINY